MESESVEIPLSKGKMVFLILGSLLFVVLSVFMFLNAEGMLTRRINNPFIIRIIAIIGILFFGLILISVIKKIMSNESGLTINNEGIWDNSSGVSVGMIKWTDIIGIRKVKASGVNFILIDVNNPDYYINNAKGRIKRLAMKANTRKYNTPISISTAGLKISFKELEKLIKQEYNIQAH